jgi:hypothetical protein
MVCECVVWVVTVPGVPGTIMGGGAGGSAGWVVVVSSVVVVAIGGGLEHPASKAAPLIRLAAAMALNVIGFIKNPPGSIGWGDRGGGFFRDDG